MYLLISGETMSTQKRICTLASIARYGVPSLELQEPTQYLPPEDALNALRVKSRAAYQARRILYKLSSEALLSWSHDIALSANRISRIYADQTGSELPESAPLLDLIVLTGIPVACAADPFVYCMAGHRRPALTIRWNLKNLRPRKNDLIGIADVTAFGLIWGNLEDREVVLEAYCRYDSLHEVPEKLKRYFGSKISAEVNSRLDKIDHEAFGGIPPVWSEASRRIFDLFDRIGGELAISWDALSEFRDPLQN